MSKTDRYVWQSEVLELARQKAKEKDMTIKAYLDQLVREDNNGIKNEVQKLRSRIEVLENELRDK